ncbi:MAG: hypothetical protein O2910_00400 [Proteobacteria bacterium]|nr:hypothetical protein [Pseudomonadota bacterium]
MELSASKLPPAQVLAVDAIGNHVKRPDIFLAPRDVSAISVMRRQHPYALVPRPAYLSFAYDFLSGEEIARRTLLLRLIAPNEIETGSGPLVWEALVERNLVFEDTWENRAKEAFVTALQQREIALYAIPIDNPMNKYLEATFTAHGYPERETVSELVLWTRQPNT